MRTFALTVLWICLLCLPALLAIALLLYRRMVNSVGGDSREEWKMIHQTQDMRAERIEHNTESILRKLSEDSPQAGATGTDESGPAGE